MFFLSLLVILVSYLQNHCQITGRANCREVAEVARWQHSWDVGQPGSALMPNAAVQVTEDSSSGTALGGAVKPRGVGFLQLCVCKAPRVGRKTKQCHNCYQGSRLVVQFGLFLFLLFCSFLKRVLFIIFYSHKTKA